MSEIQSNAAAPSRQYALAFTFSLALWLLLVGKLSLDELVAGIIVAFGVALTAGPHLQILSGIRLHPAAPLHLVLYLAHFSVALVRANLDMARRVLSPVIPLRPELVEVRTRLRSPLGRLMLANSITLTPGTLSVDVRDDLILVHWIDCPPGYDAEAATRRIAADFERHLEGFLE